MKQSSARPGLRIGTLPARSEVIDVAGVGPDTLEGDAEIPPKDTRYGHIELGRIEPRPGHDASSGPHGSFDRGVVYHAANADAGQGPGDTGLGQIGCRDGQIRGMVTQWQPHRRLAYSWNVHGPGDAESSYPDSYLSFALTPEGEPVEERGAHMARNAALYGVDLDTLQR